MTIAYWGLAFLLVAGIWFLFRRDDISRLVSKPQPTAGYEEAVRKIEAVHQDENGQALLDVCNTKLMTHDVQTEHVIVFMHGYTNCPEQFQEIGQRFFELGYNVYIPCMPYHGRANRLTQELGRLTAEDMAAYGDLAIDIARGLGKQVTVLGLSGGGTVAAWLAQNREDVDLAVPLAAFLRISVLPSLFVLPFINLIRALPEKFLWWDPRTKEKNPFSVYYAYPQYSLHSLMQVLRLGRAVKNQAGQKPPLARKILMVINDFDPSVSNAEINSLLKIWMKFKKNGIRSYHFEKEMHMLHDIITPETPGVPHEEVYQRLIEQVQTFSESPSRSIV
jgi:pimeloyl-ACP methyl ester carboxylesterase